MGVSMRAVTTRSAIAACAVLFGRAALAPGQGPAGAAFFPSARPGPEFVVERLDDTSSNPSGLTLRDALERAARDPRDNLIRLAPGLRNSEARTIRLERPLVYSPPQGLRTGRDSLEGGAHGLVIRAGADAPALLHVRGGALRLRNVTLEGGREHTILLADQASLELQDCRVTGGGVGIVAVAGSRLQWLDGRIADHRLHGIELRDASFARIQGAIIESNAQAGLAALDRSTAALERCVVRNCGQWGITASNDAHVRAVRVELLSAGFANVDCGERSTAELEACRIADGPRFGMLAVGNSRLTARRCDVADNGWRGLELQGEAAAELCECTVERSGHFGIVLFGKSALRMQGGGVRRNRGHGLAIRDRAVAEISDCRFENNEYSGVGAPDAADGGRLYVRRCLFHANGMRPVCRGPIHIDPPVPTTARIASDLVVVRTAPHATVDLYADPVGEAARYLRSVTADAAGEFRLRLDEVPVGEVITAAATTADGHTSEFNVIAGPLDAAILSALLARTGPFSDSGGPLDPSASVQRWRRGTRVVFAFDEPPPRHIEAYVRWFLENLPGWVDRAIQVEARFGAAEPPAPGAAIVPIRYASPSDNRLNGTGGTTFTQWDASGYFDGTNSIVLARPDPGEQPCPRVAVHEMCHALGLYHARVGLLSRMQGLPPPPAGYINDFSPAPTFFDVAALHILYAREARGPANLAGLAAPSAASLALHIPPAPTAPTDVASATPDASPTPPATRR